MDLLLRTVVDGVSVHDRRGRLIYANRSLWSVLGLDAVRVLEGRGTNGRLEFEDEHGRRVPESLLPPFRALREDAAVEQLLQLRRDGRRTEHWVRAQARVAPRADGRGQAVVTVWHLASDEQATRQRIREARTRYALLSNLSRLLARAELTPERFGDAVAGLSEELGTPCMLEAVTAPDQRVLTRFTHSPKDDGAFAHDVDVALCEHGSEARLEALDAGFLEGWLEEEELASLLRPLSGVHAQALMRHHGMQSALRIPIRVGVDLVGALTVFSPASQAQGARPDPALLADVGSRMCTALLNARALAATRAAVETRDAFISIAAHELRTPLTALHLLLEAMRRKSLQPASSAVPDWLKPRIDAAWRQSRHVRALVLRLLDISQLNAGGIRLSLEPVDLRGLCTDLADQVSEQLTEAGCPLELELEQVTCLTDFTRVEQVLCNLLENACKYARGKPVKLKVRRVWDLAEITVSDLGEGIPASDHARVFGRYERSVTAEGISGSGLGLYVVRQVVEALGGDIVLRSAPGQGATFVITLPLGGPDV